MVWRVLAAKNTTETKVCRRRAKLFSGPSPSFTCPVHSRNVGRSLDAFVVAVLERNYRSSFGRKRGISARVEPAWELLPVARTSREGKKGRVVEPSSTVSERDNRPAELTLRYRHKDSLVSSK